jgi:hypothetical protein
MTLKVWPEPEKFMSDRFLDDDKQELVDFHGRGFELLLFGSARRMCPGTPLAVCMVYLILPSLLHRFHWTLPADVEKNGRIHMRERLGLNLSMATPLQAPPPTPPPPPAAGRDESCCVQAVACQIWDAWATACIASSSISRKVALKNISSRSQ